MMNNKLKIKYYKTRKEDIKTVEDLQNVLNSALCVYENYFKNEVAIL